MSTETKSWLLAYGIAITFLIVVVINNANTPYTGQTAQQKIHDLCKDRMGVNANNENEFNFTCVDGSSGYYRVFADGSSEFKFYPMEK